MSVFVAQWQGEKMAAVMFVGDCGLKHVGRGNE